jgi:translation initiation factor eIF-2B subunit delta
MDSFTKSRETIKAEREAKKLIKAATKRKDKIENIEHDQPLTYLNKVNIFEKQVESKTNINKEIITDSGKIPTYKKKTMLQNIVMKEEKEFDGKYKLEEYRIVSNKQKVKEKSKAELRAERRAKQEAQRTVKQAIFIDKKKAIKNITEKIQEKSVILINKDQSLKKTSIKSEITENLHEVNLFKHLYIKKKNISEYINNSNHNIHPVILKLGVQYSEKVIVGSNARCVALLAAVKQFIQDFERPSHADFTRGLEINLQESLRYLNLCRPSAVSMQNAVKHLKWQMSTLPSTITDQEVCFDFNL